MIISGLENNLVIDSIYSLKDKEVFLPDTVKKNIANGNLLLRNIVSESIWAGLTYKEDMEDLENKIHTLIENGEYPNNLWED